MPRNQPSERLHAFIAGLPLRPRIALVLGSGLADVAARIDVSAQADLDELLGFTAATVPGHSRSVIAGYWGQQPVLAILGRYHLYQGLSAPQVAAPVAALADTDVTTLILTNAAGGINSSLNAGDLMLIDDHINLPAFAGISPLVPPATPTVEFVPMRKAYSPRLLRIAEQAAHLAGVRLKRGVYAFVAGPSYETSAELNLLRLIGADAVGMSTVPETIMARSLGLEVLGLSTITNLAIPEVDVPVSHNEVLTVGQSAGRRLVALFDQLLPLIGPSPV